MRGIKILPHHWILAKPQYPHYQSIYRWVLVKLSYPYHLMFFSNGFNWLNPMKQNVPRMYHVSESVYLVLQGALSFSLLSQQKLIRA